MKITKLLSENAKPAPALVARAKPIVLTFAQRIKAPAIFQVNGVEFENALGDTRPLEVGDVLLDEKGGFYVIKAGVDKQLRVTGEFELMHDAAVALVTRGFRVAELEDGFAIVSDERVAKLLTNIGLKLEAFEGPFEPLQIKHGCCCHHHDHDEGCCCGHHHHEEGEGCCCGHHHKHGAECSCGQHHEHGEECACGHHHEHGEECTCGHHHEHGEECSCGHHHKHGEECSCGHHHEHGEGCGCGHHHNH